MNELKDRFLQLSPREQLSLGILFVAVTLTLLYVLLLAPIAKKRDKQLVNNKAVATQHMEVRQLASEVLGQQKAGGRGQASLAQVTNNSLGNHGLRMEDFNPSGNSNARVRLANVEYNKVMAWLDELENKEGIQVKEVSVTAGDVKGVLATVMVKLYRN